MHSGTDDYNVVVVLEFVRPPDSRPILRRSSRDETGSRLNSGRAIAVGGFAPSLPFATRLLPSLLTPIVCFAVSVFSPCRVPFESRYPVCSSQLDLGHRGGLDIERDQVFALQMVDVGFAARARQRGHSMFITLR